MCALNSIVTIKLWRDKSGATLLMYEYILSEGSSQVWSVTEFVFTSFIVSAGRGLK